MEQEKQKLLSLWSMVRWFLVIVLFSIGLLHISFREGMYQNLLFFMVFGGIVALNLLFQVQTGQQRQFVKFFQVALDILFATLIVHLTGGLNSFFVWAYLIGVITASLTFPQNGGVIAGLCGSFSLLMLIVLYQNSILTPMEASGMDMSGSTVYLLSYTGLFSGVALIANYLSDQISRDRLDNEQLISKVNELKECETWKNEMERLLPSLKEIAHLDHDINTPLCVITLSLGRVKRYANEMNLDGLHKSNTEITEAVNKISLLLQRLKSIKESELIGYHNVKTQDNFTQVNAPAGNLEIADLQTTYTKQKQKRNTNDKIDPALEELLKVHDKQATKGEE
ncbi:MAG: histidine kinase [Candidatus Cloacimonetes bacterium]|nr:histidine kinase [Candidatus Cloacimonadota bacterium]MDD4686948.1 histidine kinase [Candidatus Cloacimonadota bacterium]